MCKNSSLLSLPPCSAARSCIITAPAALLSVLSPRGGSVTCSCQIGVVSQMLLLLFPEEGYVKMYLKGRPITMFLPKDQVDSYCLEARADPPGNKLKLDWVYPFSAHFLFSFWSNLVEIIATKRNPRGRAGIQLWF